MEQTLYIILGWLLGILSPGIIKRISNGYEKRNLKKIIFSDLIELKKRLAALSFRVLPKYGKLDEETFEWLKNNSGANFSKRFNELLETGVDLKIILNQINKEGLQEKTHTYFKKMHLFIIDSHLTNISLIDSPLIDNLLEIKFHIEAFNEDVESFREHLKMTFQPEITDTNHQIISQEIENKSIYIAEKSRYIVDKINNVLEN